MTGDNTDATLEAMPGQRTGPGRRAIIATLRLFVVIGLFVTLPGISEAVDDTAHWLNEGHTVHDGSTTDRGCDDDCGEHGCSGLQHFCRCCPSTQGLPTPQPVAHVSVTSRPVLRRWHVRAGAGIGARAPAIRPPIA